DSASRSCAPSRGVTAHWSEGQRDLILRGRTPSVGVRPAFWSPARRPVRTWQIDRVGGRRRTRRGHSGEEIPVKKQMFSNARTLLTVAVVLGVAIGAAGCGRLSFSSLAAKKAYKEANEAYRASDWKKAVDRYESALSSDPNLVAAYFYLGNSCATRYKPARAGEAENDSHIKKAIENYRKAAEKDTDPKMKKLALDYLVAAYGPEKLNDPAQAEPVVQQIIQMEPTDPTGYL